MTFSRGIQRGTGHFQLIRAHLIRFEAEHARNVGNPDRTSPDPGI
jgi:hypothetical protein